MPSDRPRVEPRRTALATLAIVAALATSAVAQLDAVPGTAMPPPLRPLLAAPAAEGGLQLIVNERGRITRSIAGVTDDGAGGLLTVQKPAGATLRGAWFFIATTGFTFTPLSFPVSLGGVDVPLEHETPSGIASYNYWTDVTAYVKPPLDAAPAGPVSFLVREPEPYLTDGEIMVVVWDDPAQPADQTVSILFGALSPTGDEYHIALARPISLADPETHLEMSLGISYSYQSFGTQQYSVVDVNGQRLTTSAGGEDDGLGHNGALLTVGGDGDSPGNPVDPYATPTNPRSDDELYDLIPFVADGDSRIDVQTSNPSLDDNIFVVTFTMNPPVVGIATGAGHRYVAVGDSTTTGFSVPTCTEDRTTSPYGCIGDPPATPYPVRIQASGDPRFADLDRTGIWGYTIREAVVAADQGHDEEGPWEPQLLAAQKATELVTVSLGANDMQFSDVGFWLKECLAKQFTSLRPTCLDAARARAEEVRPDVQAMLDRLDAAGENGANVVITLYYNPINDQKDAGPFGLFSRDCTLLWSISEIIVGAINNVLEEEAAYHGFTVVDFRPPFRTHGAGSSDSFVFGSDCDAAGAATAIDVHFHLGWPPITVDKKATEAEIKKRFDPHPNDKGTTAQANEILKAVE